MKQIALVLLTLFAFAAPWEYSLDLGEPLGNVARILGLLLLLAILPAIAARGAMRMPGQLQWLVLAFFLYLACTYFWTIDQPGTLAVIRGYSQVLMVVWIAWEIIETPMQLRWLLRAFVAGCWVLAVLTLLDFVSADAQASEQIRFVAQGQDPNDVARYLDLGFPFAALLFATEQRWTIRLSAVAYLPAGLLAVLLTASRGGFSAAIAAALGLLLLLVRWRPRAVSAAIAALAAAACLVWLYVPAGSLDRLATIPEQVGSGDLNDRLGLWIAGWRAFRLAPWWGYGAGTYSAAAGLAPADTAHNTVMSIAVSGGLLGTAIFLAILAFAIRTVAQCRGLLRIALATTMAVWAIASMVGSSEENRLTWLLFAIMAVAARLTSEDETAMQVLFSNQAHNTAPAAESSPRWVDAHSRLD